MNIEIEHSAKGSQRPNHKYVSRKLVNGKWQYYYKYSKVNQYKNDVDYYKNKASEASKQSKLNAVSAKGHADKAIKRAIDRYTKIQKPGDMYDTQMNVPKAASRAVKSNYYKNKTNRLNKKIAKAEAALYTEARNDARKVMADPRYQKKIAKNAAKSVGNVRKKKVNKAKEKALKKLAFKNKVNYTINKGRLKVKKILRSLKRK